MPGVDIKNIMNYEDDELCTEWETQGHGQENGKLRLIFIHSEQRR